MEIIDELPAQFQKRDWKLKHTLKAGEKKVLFTTTTCRAWREYKFGNTILYIKSLLGILQTQI